MKPSPLRVMSEGLERRPAGETGTLMGGFADAKTPAAGDSRARERVVRGSMVIMVEERSPGSCMRPETTSIRLANVDETKRGAMGALCIRLIPTQT